MNSLSRCAEDTIARSTAAAMNPHGGVPLELIQPSRPMRWGCERIRCRQHRARSGRRPHRRRPRSKVMRTVIGRSANRTLTLVSRGLPRLTAARERNVDRWCRRRILDRNWFISFETSSSSDDSLSAHFGGLAFYGIFVILLGEIAPYDNSCNYRFGA
jgi:hypothetical protein